jgi:hypothetical protein
VSAPAYGYRNELADLELPTGGTVDGVADVSLAMGAGICGNAAMTAAAILERLGVATRFVQLYYGHGDNHIALEASWRGRWHYLDPTWGTYYRHRGNILALSDVLALTPPQRAAAEVANETLAWRYVVERVPALHESLLRALEQRPLRVVWGLDEATARTYD